MHAFSVPQDIPGIWAGPLLVGEKQRDIRPGIQWPQVPAFLALLPQPLGFLGPVASVPVNEGVFSRLWGAKYL